MQGTVLLMLALNCFTSNFLKEAKEKFAEDTVVVKKTADFQITGNGDNAAWRNTSWQTFSRIDSGGKNYKTQSKILYSETGIYLLFEGEDDRVTTKNYNDDDEIYEGDVFEFFVQAEKGKPYFEYEINHLGRQLILTLSGTPHGNLAWSPWRYEYNKHPLIRKKVFIKNKDNTTNTIVKPGSLISSWSAEIFFPYELFSLLPGGKPKPGTVWRGNFCRIDYDSGNEVPFSWSKKIKKDFHELENFGTIVFE